MKHIVCMLLRHGKTKGNTEKRYLGCNTDEPLLDEEKDLLQPMSGYSNKDLLFVSPMIRARQTAALFLPEAEQEPIDELKETDFGRFENKNYPELKDEPDYQAWIDSGGTIAFPEGEHPEDFRQRSFKGFEKALLKAAEQDCSKFWIVAHGGTVMSIMSRLTGKEYFDFMVSCGEGYELELSLTEEGSELLSYQPVSGRKMV